MITLLLAALMNLSSHTLEINEPLIVTLDLPKEVSADIDLLRGKLFESGNFLLLEEKEENNIYTWKLEPLRAGTFPLSFYQVGPLYTPIEFVTVRPFHVPETVLLPSFLPMTPDLPPSLSAENQRLLAASEAAQPKRNLALIRQKTFPYLPFLAAILFLSLGPLLAWYRQKKERERPQPTPEERALYALSRLESGPSSDPATLVFNLSSLVRTFLQERFGLAAPHQTTEEFLKRASHHPLLQGARGEKLALFLLASDRVKFASHTPQPSEIDSALAYARALFILEI